MRRRLLIVVASVGLVLCAVLLIAGHMKKQPTTAVVAPTVPSAPTVQPSPQSTASLTPTVQVATPSVPATTLASVPPLATPLDNGRQSAVTAAATAINLVSAAELLPTAQMQTMIEKLVVADQQQALMQAYAASGIVLAHDWGYQDLNEANTRSSYFVETQKYRIDSFQNQTATISLYIVSHWVTVTNLEYQVPSITIVTMRQVNGIWLYASSSSPPASDAPQPLVNLTYDQTVLRFQPYLKGFDDYVTTNP